LFSNLLLRLIIIGFLVDNSLFVDGNMPVSVPKDIEDEANSYFQRIYNLAPHHSLSIDEVLEMLKRFQESPVKRERVITIFYQLNISNYIDT
jgi:hypothetical protein